MKKKSTRFLTILAMSLTLAFTGCSDPESETAGDGGTISDPPPATVDMHAHPTEGPHHGDLIELGNEEYHAELIHPEDHDDDAHASETSEAGHEHAGITIYILDSSAKEMVAIEASEITINLSHDEKPEQFKLQAMPTDSDPEGKSSRFASADKDLMEHFHEDEVEAKLVLTINGKSFRGDIHHHHDGEGHKHDH